MFSSVLLMGILLSLFVFMITPDYKITILNSRKAVIVGENCEYDFLVELKRMHFALPSNLEISVSKIHGAKEMLHVRIPTLFSDSFKQNNTFIRKLPLKIQHTVNIMLPSDRRNYLEVGPLKVSSSDFFGLFKVSTAFLHKHNVYIYPAHFNLGGRRSLSVDDFSGSKVGGTSQNSMFIRNVREFIPGDQPKFVHQKISAKYSQPYVKQFENIQSSRTLIIFDNAYQNWQSDTEFEEGVSVLSSLLRLADTKFVTTHKLSRQVQIDRSINTFPDGDTRRNQDNMLRSCTHLGRVHLHSASLGNALVLLNRSSQLSTNGIRLIMLSGSKVRANLSSDNFCTALIEIVENGQYKRGGINSNAHFIVGGLQDVKRLAKDIYA